MQAAIDRQDGLTRVRVESSEDGLLFAADVRPAEAPPSELFTSTQEFGRFLADGVSSYGYSRHGSRLTKVDYEWTYRGLTEE